MTKETNEAQTAQGRMRRRLLIAAPVALVGLAAPALFRAAQSQSSDDSTPPQAEGPFYPRDLPQDSDADLTLFDGLASPGEPIEIVGTVFDLGGRPIEGAEVEIWHCDPNGVYAHVGFDTPPGFQGYGRVRAGADGAYRFTTVRPGLYPGRARHAHFKFRPPGGRTLTTQMYFPGDPTNADDGLLGRARRPERLIARHEPADLPRFAFDVVTPA